MIIIKKLLIVFLLVTPLLSTAQKTKKLSKSEKQAQELYDREFGKESDAFKVASIPEEYSDESSVLLAKKVHVVFGKNNKGNTASQIASRERIQLNDLAAVNDYSEFYYQKSDMIGITIVKPDGTETVVDLGNSVEVTTEIPKQYQDRYHGSDYSKVAIPDLQVGDIVDFFKIFSSEEAFQTEFMIPVASYTPVLHQELTIDVDENWTLYFGTLNGAPEFTRDNRLGFNMKGKQSKQVQRIRFECGKAEGKEWERWADESDEGPMIKLLAAPKNAPLHQKVRIINGLKTEDYIVKSMDGVKNMTNILEGGLNLYIKRLELKKIEESDAAEMVYRGMRILMLRSMTQAQSKDLTVTSRAISRQELAISDAIFASVFAKILDKSKIPSEIVLARGRSAKDDDFLVGREVTFGVYIPKLDKYYWPFSNFSRPGEIPYYLEGLKVFSIPYSKVYKKDAALHMKSSVLPSSTIEDNIYKITAKVNIADDNMLKYENTTDVTGYFREVYSSLFLYNTNYLLKDILFSEVDKLYDYYISGYSVKSSYTSTRSTEEFAEHEKTKNERLKKWLESEHTSLELKELFIEEFGMMNEEKRLKVGYEFSSDGFVKKAGPNLIFDIGKVYGSQLQLDHDELETRRSDVRLDCPKSIISDITITLPEGLIANGIEDLNIKVENEIGFFESTAVQEGNTIKMVATKNYKKNAFSADKWPLMVEFLEAAYDLSQKKVILK